MFEPSRRHGVFDARWPATSVRELPPDEEDEEKGRPRSSAEAAQTWDTGGGTPTSDPVARLRAA
jgi:hypothetical protein